MNDSPLRASSMRVGSQMDSIMKVIAGSDWSVGLNQFSTYASADAQLLETMGRELHARYDGLIEEPVPSLFAQILDRLDTRETASESS